MGCGLKVRAVMLSQRMYGMIRHFLQRRKVPWDYKPVCARAAFHNERLAWHPHSSRNGTSIMHRFTVKIRGNNVKNTDWRQTCVLKVLGLTIACARELQRREVQDVPDRDDQQHVDLFHYSIKAGFLSINCWLWDCIACLLFTRLLVKNLELFERWILFSHIIC